jgi:hypothetical protein
LYRERVARALEARFDMPNSTMSVGQVLDPIIPLGMVDVPTGVWYLVYPGRKNIFANGVDLTFYEFNDPRVAGVAEGRIGQGAWVPVRGDVLQVRAMALS